MLLQIGVPHRSAAYMSGRPFHRCTHTATSPDGELYVTDGYGNSVVHKYTPDGRLIKSWGGPGIGPGEFNIPHNLCCDDQGLVYVADRENHRVQVFDGEGTLLDEWRHLHRPCALCMGRPPSSLFYVGEVGPGLPVNRHVPNLGPRISVLNSQGAVLARIPNEGIGLSLSHMVAPHGIAVDSRGDIYVGEVARAAWPALNAGVAAPAGLRTLRKLVRADSVLQLTP